MKPTVSCCHDRTLEDIEPPSVKYRGAALLQNLSRRERCDSFSTVTSAHCSSRSERKSRAQRASARRRLRHESEQPNTRPRDGGMLGFGSNVSRVVWASCEEDDPRNEHSYC